MGVFKEMAGYYTKSIRYIVFGMILVLFLSVAGWSAEEPKPAGEPEAEMIIVKYGSLLVKCDEPGARIYVDDVYKGSAGNVIESIVAGEHTVSCKTDDKAVSGTFQVKKNETLRLEGNLNDGRIGPFREPAREPARTPEVAEKKKPEPAKLKKPEPKKVEPKKVDQKNPVEERRKNHLTVINVRYGISDAQDLSVEHAANQHSVSKFGLVKNVSGKYYRTKQGVLLCEAGPCEMNWNAKFVYTDEGGTGDALLLNWKETVFNGITPSGTSRQDLECCLNGECWKMQYTSRTNAAQNFEIGRYRLTWSDSSVLIRRSDIMKEILEAGRSLSDY